MTTRRLFVSVDLTDELCEEISRLQERFAPIPGVRAVDPAGVHVTLKFLGEVASDRIDEISATLASAVGAASMDSFEAMFAGLGVFPDYEYISVIWVGVRRGGTEMERLHRAIEERFVEAGFERERHDFTPHVTIARMDHGAGKERVQEFLRSTDPTVGQMQVTEIRLTESTLSPEAPVYETLARVPL